MKIKEIFETASAGSTSTGNVDVEVIYPNIAGKQPNKKKSKIAPNALDLKGANLLSGNSLLKR